MSEQLSPRRHPIVWLIAFVLLCLAISPAFTQVTSSLDSKIKVAFSGYVLNRTTGTFDTRGTLTNISADALQAPISLVITGISNPSVSLANAAGTTSDGKPYVAVPIPSGGFIPASITTVALKFKNTNPAIGFTFTHSVVGILPPIADAGKNLSGVTGKPVTLDGSASRDPQGKLLTYTWRVVQAPINSKAALIRPTTPNPSFTPDLVGTYQFELIVSNGTLSSQPAQVTLTASTVNAPPVARAGNSQNARVGVSVSLDGSASSDPEGAPLIPLWSFVSAPTGSALTDTSITSRNALKASFVPDKAGIYILKLTVSDGALSSTDTTQITVAPPNVPPNANAGTDILVNFGVSVSVNGTASTDPDAGPAPLTFLWTIVSKPIGSLLTNASIVGGNLPSASFTPDKAGSYQLKLTVSDGEAFAEDTVLATINSLPKAVDDTVTTNKNIALDISVLANDSDADSDPLSVTAVTVPTNGSAVINPNGTIKYTPKTDFVGADNFNYTINDRKGGTATAKVTVTIGSTANTPPRVNAGVAQTIVQTEVVILLGTVSDDGLPNPPGKVTTLWSKVSGPGTVTFTDAAALTSNARVSASGTYVLRLTANDSALTASADVTITATASIAPSIAGGVVTTTFDATKFLYTGANPIQTGVSANAIDPRYATALRGRVLTKSGAPLSGVKVTILRHPELGQTITRADGYFDMAGKAGGLIVVNYEKPGYFQVQRNIKPVPTEWGVLPDVVMIQADPAVTTVNLTAPGIKVARSSLVTDSHGSRRHTLFFPQGTTAQMVMPDNSRRPISTMSVRATEFTVGANGPETMPASLPPASAYTSAVVFTADEAKAAGAKDVIFNTSIPLYIENYLNMAVGTQVPMGSYDPDRAAWVASANGRVIKILSVSAGAANVDTDGDGVADSGGTLGITLAERQQLAITFTVGQSLWRMQINHFDFPWDANNGFWLPNEATPPKEPKADAPKPDSDPDCQRGSIVECQNQVLGESYPVTGTPFSLNYRSNRVPANIAGYTLPIPLTTGLKTLPSSMQNVELQITVGGLFFHRFVRPKLNDIYVFNWDGKDAFGRIMAGRQLVRVRIAYHYSTEYRLVASLGYSQVGRRGSSGGGDGVVIPDNGRSGVPAKLNSVFSQEYTTTMGGYALNANSFIDGWSLNVHHNYDVQNKIFFYGDGRILDSDNEKRIGPIITRFAGAAFREEIRNNLGDGQPALKAFLLSPIDIAAGPDGSVYVLSSAYTRQTVRRIFPDGTIKTIAGGLDATVNLPGCIPNTAPCGDGGPATSANFSAPNAIAVGPDSSVYLMDISSTRVRKIDPSGIISTVAGTGVAGFSGDGGPATLAQLGGGMSDIAVADDGTLYIADNGNDRIRMVDPGGVISTFAGKGDVRAAPISTAQPPYGDGGPAILAYTPRPNQVALGPDGSVYLTGNGLIRRVRPDGIIEAVMGIFGGNTTGIRDGVVARNSLARPLGKIDVGQDGTVYFLEIDPNIASFTPSIRFVTQQGLLGTIAGIAPGLPPPNQANPTNYLNGVPARGDTARNVNGLQAMPDGSVLDVEISVGPSPTINRISSALPGIPFSNFFIASQDGSEIYQFDSAGRHFKTINALTNADVYRFEYDAVGRLIRVTDGDGNITTIERDGSGNATAIVAPFGQRTTLTVDGAGYLSSATNPANEKTAFTYADGLMQSMTDANGSVYNFQFNAIGQLIQDTDPAGGFKRLARTDNPTSYSVSLSTALGRTTKYDVNNVVNSQTRITTDPAGLKTETTRGIDGTRTVKSPDGMTSTAGLTGDPRWGMLAPFAKTQSVKLPSGLTATAGRDRQAVLSDPSNVLSLATLTDAVNINGRSFVNSFDSATKTFTLTTPESRKVQTTIDAQGRPLKAQQASLLSINYHYDLRGRLDALSQGTGVDERKLQIAYRSDGYVDFVTDPIGRQVKFTYDGAGRVKTQTLPDGRIVNYSYDANGNLLGLTPPGKPQHAFKFTPVDLQGSYTPPTAANTGTISTNYSYNKDRQITLVTRPDGKTITPSYDLAGRLTTLALPTGTGTLTYGYDAATGNLSTIAAPGGVNLAYSYDGSLLKQTTWSGAISGNVSRTYDNNFRVTSIAVNGATPIGFQYDNDDLLKKAGDLTIARDSATGLVTGTALGVVTDSYGYNGFPELTKYTAKAGTSVLYDVSYVRDKLSRIDTKTEIVQGVTNVFKYTYDLAGRLTNVQKNGATVESYTYDSNGNRLTGTGVSNASYDAQDRLLTYGSATYTYTANGELKTKTVGGQTTTYDYDVLGILRTVVLPDGKKIEYIIDGQQRRVGKKVNDIFVKRLIYEHRLHPVAELDASGNVISRFVYLKSSNIPIYMIRGGITYRFLTDQIGSPRLIVNAATGSVVQRIEYDAFGNVIVDSSPGFQPFGFAGGLFDDATKLVRLGVRDYDSANGRWTTKETIPFFGRDLNLFTYAKSDPVNWLDPNGLASIGANSYTPEGGGGVNFFSDNETGSPTGISVELGAGLGASAEADPNAQAPSSSLQVGGRLGLQCGEFRFRGTFLFPSEQPVDFRFCVGQACVYPNSGRVTMRQPISPAPVEGSIFVRATVNFREFVQTIQEMGSALTPAMNPYNWLNGLSG